jgi:hypothetical protein
LSEDEGHRIPLIHRTDVAHLEVTIEEIQVGLEYIAEKHGIPPAELWATAQKLRAEQRDADYRRESALDMQRRDLLVKNREWVVEFGDTPLQKTLVIFESGGIIPSEKLMCGQCKTKLLVGEGGERFIRGRFLNRGTSVNTKNELFQLVRTEVTNPKTSTYIACYKCQNVTANFSIIETPK